MNNFRSSMIIIGKILLLVIMVFVLMLVVMVPIVIVSSLLNKGISTTEELTETALMNSTMMFVQTICVIVAVILMYISFDRKSSLTLGWKQADRLRAVIAGSAWGVVLMTALFLCIWAFGGLQVIDVFWNAKVVGSLAFGVLLFALVAINEELLCRGYIQGLIRGRLGPNLAIMITSLLFMSLHLMNDNVLDSPIPLINLFLAGVLLGVSRETSGGLWVPIGIHFTWNYFQGYIYGFEVSGEVIENPFIAIQAQGNEWLSGGSFGAEGSLVASVILIVAIYFFWSKGMKQKRPSI